MPRHIPLRRNRTSGAGCFHLHPSSRQAESDDPFPDDFETMPLGRELASRFADIDRATKAPHHVLVSTMSTQDALSSARRQGHVLEWVHGVAMGVRRVGPRLECLACRNPWTKIRTPVAVVITELVPLDRAMISGLCQNCVEQSDLHARIFAALERDLGLNTATARPIHSEARA